MKFLQTKYKIKNFSSHKELTFNERVGAEALLAAVWTPIPAKVMNSYIKLHAMFPATQKRMITMGSTYQDIFGDTVTSFKRV